MCQVRLFFSSLYLQRRNFSASVKCISWRWLKNELDCFFRNCECPTNPMFPIDRPGKYALCHTEADKNIELRGHLLTWRRLLLPVITISAHPSESFLLGEEINIHYVITNPIENRGPRGILLTLCQRRLPFVAISARKVACFPLCVQILTSP